jgi:low affinity Fe/Cu permease
MVGKSSSWFTRFAKRTARAVGEPYVFAVALMTVIVWAAVGPLFNYSDTWQLVINTGTTIVTFLMVFLIQNTQNRDSTALQIKLDELIRSIEGAKNELLDLEELDECELEATRATYQKLAESARDRLRSRRADSY